MLGLGWTEMLVIAALALIVVGPRDLPVMLRQLGRAFGVMRRMGNEFRAEFNKMAAIDDIKEARRSITEPLRDARTEIQREFNKTTSAGVKPSGALKPDEGEGESVVGAIKTQAGMNAGAADEAMSKALEQSRAKVGDGPPLELSGDTAGGASKKSAKPRASGKPGSASKPARKPRAKSASAKSAEAKIAAKPKAAASKSTASKTGSRPKPEATAKSAVPKSTSKPAAKPKAAAGKAKSTVSKAGKAAGAKPAETKPANVGKPKTRAARNPATAKAGSGAVASAKPPRRRAATKTEKA